MILSKNKARFAMEGFRVRRSNPDGTIPSAQRIVGFIGTIDLSAFVASNKAPFKYKIDGGSWEDGMLDFETGSVDPSAVTPEIAADLLDDAVEVSGLTWSVDELIGRLIGGVSISSPIKEIQLKGLVIAAMDFGQGIACGGLGTYWKSYFGDEAISCTFPADMVDKEQIDLEGAKGSVTRMVIPAKRMGSSPVLAMKYKDDELLQMLQGGVYIPATESEPGIYEPPASDNTNYPNFVFEAFAPLYSDGSSKMSQVIGMERKLFRICSATEGDVPMEAKSWAQYGYNINATDYTDENGKKLPSEKRFEYSVSQYDALGLDKI
jgi:hypothetical protein